MSAILEMEFTTRDAMRPSFFRVEDLSTHWTMAGNARHGERKRTGDKRKQTKSSSKRNYNNIGAGGLLEVSLFQIQLALSASGRFVPQN